AQRLRLDFSFSEPAMPMLGLIQGQIPVSQYVGSVEYSQQALVVAAEYSRWVLEVDSNQPSVFPSLTQKNDRAYILATYQILSWLHPGAYYSVYFPYSYRHRDGPAASQHDVPLTLRFDVNSFWLIKVEGHYMHGTAVLNAMQNGNVLPDQLERNWGLFLVKTTLHF